MVKRDARGQNILEGLGEVNTNKTFKVLLKSGSLAANFCLGPGHGRSRTPLLAHKFARSLAVVTVEVLVMQNIIIGFFCEYFKIISGSLCCVITYLPPSKRYVHVTYFRSHAPSKPNSLPL